MIFEFVSFRLRILIRTNYLDPDPAKASDHFRSGCTTLQVGSVYEETVTNCNFVLNKFMCRSSGPGMLSRFMAPA
jgi:hypothetical protein